MKANEEQHKTDRQVVTRVVDTRWLYNNFYIGVVIIDARPAHAVVVNTLLDSVHIPPLDPCVCLSDVDAHLEVSQQPNFTPTRRFLRDVVIVGEAHDENQCWQRRLLQLLVSEGVIASVALMDGDFISFQKRYPFYTTAHQEIPRDPMTIKRITYPNEILDNVLYLGNMWHAKSKQIIQDLGITHIVNATLDLGNVFKDDGVQYYEVKIPDQADADISKYFNPTCAFIDSARAAQSPSQHRRVLVHCTQGISRSATLVLVYLMRSNRWSLVVAFNHTHRSRPVIIPNNGFFQQLLAEERRLFHGCNSLLESEIDALLQGRLEDREPTIPYRDPVHSQPAQSARIKPCQLM